MFGAIAGDVIGSYFEFRPNERTDFIMFQSGTTFTDDTVLTVAVADSILNSKDYAATIREYGLKYPNAGYGGMFCNWLRSNSMAHITAMETDRLCGLARSVLLLTTLIKLCKKLKIVRL